MYIYIYICIYIYGQICVLVNHNLWIPTYPQISIALIAVAVAAGGLRTPTGLQVRAHSIPELWPNF